MTDFERVEQAIAAIRRGEMVIMVDDEDRENEGDLVIAAQHCDAEKVNFMCREGRGLICLSLTEKRVDELGLPMMVPTAEGDMGTAFTISIEAKVGVTTGISAADRARTIEVASDPQYRAKDLVSPGHIFPLRAKEGGVLVRSGHTEGSVDLARMAGCRPAAVICEIMREDGTMARMDDLERFATQHQLQIVSISDLIAYRLKRELLVEKEREEEFVSPIFGIEPGRGWTVRSYRTQERLGSRFLVFTKGDIDNFPERVLPLRAQRSQILGDVFGHGYKDSASHLRAAFAQIEAAGEGVVLYVIGAQGATSTEESVEHTPGLRPKESGFRDFGLGAQVLRSLGVRRIRVLTNNPRKIVGLDGYGIEVVGSEALNA